MTTYNLEYEIPPLRATYHAECDADTVEEARAQFAKEIPIGHIRRIIAITAPAPTDKGLGEFTAYVAPRKAQNDRL